MSYGIPCEQPADLITQLSSGINENNTLLNTVLAALIQEIEKVTAENQLLIDQSTKTIESTVAKNLSSSDKLINTVLAPIMESVQTPIIENTNILALAEQAATNGGLTTIDLTTPQLQVQSQTTVSQSQSQAQPATVTPQPVPQSQSQTTTVSAPISVSESTVETVTTKPIYPSLAAALATVGMTTDDVDDPYGIDEFVWTI